jgi:hypothetical protein
MSSQLFRISGLALLVGAVAFIVYIVTRSDITAGPDPATFYKEDLWVPINALGATGAMLVLMGLPAVCARMAGLTGLTGLLGLVGVALIAIAWMFFGVFLSLYGVLVAPWLADQAPSLVAGSAPLPAGFIIAFSAGLVSQSVGTVLLAIPFIRRRVEPSWVGYMLPVSALAAVVGDLIASNGPATNLAVNLASNLGPALLLVALGYIGLQMLSEHAPAMQTESRVHPSLR